MNVPYVDLSSGFNTPEIIGAITSVLRSGQYILGPEVERLESRFAQLCGVRYAVGVNSGTDALFLSLKALDVGQGDEVITVPNTFIATVGAIAATGARPVFVDVNHQYNMNPDLVEDVITGRTRAIIPVHLTGNPADMEEITELSEKYEISVIGDACQAVGASIEENSVGSFGDIGCFSLHPLKNLNVCGDGGLIVTNSEKIKDRLLLLRNHGLQSRDKAAFLGYNSRLDTIHAAVANVVLDNLNCIIKRRIENAKLYDKYLEQLVDYIVIPPRKPDKIQTFSMYVIQAKDRDKLTSFLEKKGIEAKVHYPIPIHLQEACSYLGYKEGDFPVCEAQAASILSLPVHQYLSKEQIEYVIKQIFDFYNAMCVQSL